MKGKKMATSYSARELQAIEGQGIDSISIVLDKLDINHHIDQTGGFNMVIRIKLSDENYPYLSLTSEVLTLTKSENCDGNNIIATFNSFDINQIAQTVQTALDHLNPLRENETIYPCATCENEYFAVWQGDIAIQSGTYLEFTCKECRGK